MVDSRSHRSCFSSSEDVSCLRVCVDLVSDFALVGARLPGVACRTLWRVSFCGVFRQCLGCIWDFCLSGFRYWVPSESSCSLRGVCQCSLGMTLWAGDLRDGFAFVSLPYLCIRFERARKFGVTYQGRGSRFDSFSSVSRSFGICCCLSSVHVLGRLGKHA